MRERIFCIWVGNVELVKELVLRFFVGRRRIALVCSNLVRVVVFIFVFSLFILFSYVILVKGIVIFWYFRLESWVVFVLCFLVFKE